MRKGPDLGLGQVETWPEFILSKLHEPEPGVKAETGSWSGQVPDQDLSGGHDKARAEA